jgi:inosine-uridine nucleoside N-ribohydrolase
MARKVIIDCDPGIDDALAISLALWDPALEVLAITACAGTTDAEQSTSNLLTLVEKLDPPLFPRLSSAVDPEQGAAAFNGSLLHGDRGLGDAKWEPVSRQHSVSSDKLMIEQLRAHPGEVTVVCTGPLTNLAKAIGRDPAVAGMIDRVVIAGGTLRGIGNITPCAEFNFHFDPQAAHDVLHSPTTKTLIPLEVSNRLSFGWEIVEKLPERYTKVGEVLHELVPYYLRSTRQHLGHEMVSFQAVCAILSLIDPEILECTEMAGDIEIGGELTRGALIYDQRDPRQWRANMEVAVSIDIGRATQVFYGCLRQSGLNA